MHRRTPTPQNLRTLSVGGITFDLFIRSSAMKKSSHEGETCWSLPLGAKARIDDLQGKSGGGANNTATSLARLGCTSACCGIIGDDQWGHLLTRVMEREGVNHSPLTIVEGESTSVSMILRSEDGERTILVYPGTSTHLSDVTFDRSLLGRVDALFLNHIHREGSEILNDILAAVQKRPALRLAWNPGGWQVECGMHDPESSALLRETDLLLLNREEALTFTEEQTPEGALRALIAAGVHYACITDGKNGSMGTDGKTLYHCASAPCTVMDVTGAGDAFGSAAFWSLLRGDSLPNMLSAGSINGASVVERTGAQDGLLTTAEIRRRLSSTPLAITAVSL